MGNKANIGQLNTIRQSMEKSMLPQIRDYRNQYVQPTFLKSYGYQKEMQDLMNDESKRGYSERTKGLMYGRQADALSGARASFSKDLNRQVSAQGLSNTGQAIRNMMEYDTENSGKLREAARDVELSDAEAKREDYWNAAQGRLQGIGAMGDASRNMLAGVQAEGQYWQSDADIAALYSQLQQAQQQLDSNGFWGSFKRGFGGSLGAGLGGMLTGTPKPQK